MKKKIIKFVLTIVVIMIAVLLTYIIPAYLYQYYHYPEIGFENKNEPLDKIILTNKKYSYNIYTAKRNANIVDKINNFFVEYLRDYPVNHSETIDYCYLYFTDIKKKVAIRGYSEGNDDYECKNVSIVNKNMTYFKIRRDYHGYRETSNELHYYNIETDKDFVLHRGSFADRIQIYVLSYSGDKVLIISNERVLIYKLSDTPELLLNVRLKQKLSLFDSGLGKEGYIFPEESDNVKIIKIGEVKEDNKKIYFSEDLFRFDKRFSYKLEIDKTSGDFESDVTVDIPETIEMKTIKSITGYDIYKTYNYYLENHDNKCRLFLTDKKKFIDLKLDYKQDCQKETITCDKVLRNGNIIIYQKNSGNIYLYDINTQKNSLLFTNTKDNYNRPNNVILSSDGSLIFITTMREAFLFKIADGNYTLIKKKEIDIIESDAQITEETKRFPTSFYAQNCFIADFDYRKNILSFEQPTPFLYDGIFKRSIEVDFNDGGYVERLRLLK